MTAAVLPLGPLVSSKTTSWGIAARPAYHARLDRIERLGEAPLKNMGQGGSGDRAHCQGAGAGAGYAACMGSSIRRERIG